MGNICIENAVLREAVMKIRDEMKNLEMMASKTPYEQPNVQNVYDAIQTLAALTVDEAEAVAHVLKRTGKPTLALKRSVQKAREAIALLNMDL